ALVLVPLAHLSIGVKGLLLFGSKEQKERYLPGAASGSLIFAFALTEPGIGSDAKNIQTTARLSEDGGFYRLNGTKTYITNANYARAITVFARVGGPDSEKTAGFIVESDRDGLTVGRDMPKMGLHASSTAMIRFKDVRVPAANLLGAEGDGFKMAMTILNYGRLGLGAASAGLMERSCQDMGRRAASRKQFGRPIKAFELVQEKMVRARVHAFASRAMNRFAAWILEEHPLADCALETSHAKLYGTTRCWDTLYEALQTAGGSGYLTTLPYEKRLRDFRVTTIFEGTTEIHSIYPPLKLAREIGRDLKDRPAASRLLALAGLRFRRTLKGIRADHPLLNRALAVAAKSEILLRRHLSSALFRYQDAISQEQFRLRRMTELSLSLYWLLAGVAFLRGSCQDGDYPQEMLLDLEYLIEEARECQQAGKKARLNPKERVHRKIVRSGLQHTPTGK
ncbi:MAG: acyl-CoA dehydrogenase family protein, partial [Thermodesulfobacteriota bacterium]